ncbi:MAG TPA: hypothetical protein VKT99_05055 [Xanthobacteraceae bacterium]|nr:hypothetical protein [Xanthobacteraceae bacterium]
MPNSVVTLSMLFLIAALATSAHSAISLAQESAQSPMAESTTAQAPHGKKSGTWQKYRREDVQAVMTKVAQDVWHSQYSGASAQHMEELFLDGQRAYFHGDYDGAMHNFLTAERIVSKYPNDITAGQH